MTLKTSELTGDDNYFEDFVVGAIFRHARGKTVEAIDNVQITNLVLNTAQAHFNEDSMRDNPMFDQRVSFGGVTIALVVGLAMQDTGEQALAELGMDKIRLKAPVFHGDSLYAYSQVLALDESERQDAGIASFHHWGVNQDDVVVFEGDRRVLLKRRSHWAER
ncbi:MAG: MaoC family dehydratase [Alphaproteobacteria bacterium]|jgi:acyl dehydratase|nr:acyl dehydratase [Rhodospirillaceae bacterium]MDP6407231.1 MaoC family dehydratase [Alphaproteobacteria bacterium]MDP6623709.1 MaoC family dehydratase [Alphaproteobacteria bacterium]|tara:strand:- start:1482 stop:1970 length:489 start_codon:yes stop_codon:yes gene_type:complete